MTAPAADFAADARHWLAARVPRRVASDLARVWGEGPDDVSVFHALAPDEERAVLRRAQQWQAVKFDAGYAEPEVARLFAQVESEFEVPEAHETFSVTVNLIAPTIREHGTTEQRDRFVARFTRADELCCQLFSEPNAGSDLASLTTRADRDGDDWVVSGQKVWSSGARFAEWGLLIARTDFASKHDGLTAFLVPMDAPGVEVRPIRQMSGGASFNEVFLADVRITDGLRLGDVGAGWQVTLTTLGFERETSGAATERIGGSAGQVTALAKWLGRSNDPLLRQALARLHSDAHVGGAAGSIGKLQWTEGMRRMSATVSSLLGPRLVADTGEWGTYAWSAHVLGAPGYRIAGGSDEIQRNIIGERVLGLPREPRGVDRPRPVQEVSTRKEGRTSGVHDG